MAASTIVASVTTASGLVCSVDLTRPADISIAVAPAGSTPTLAGADGAASDPATAAARAGSDGVRAFHLPLPVAPPAQFGDTSIAVDAGASVNCPVASICFHSCVTHTECVGHMLPGRVTLYDIPQRRHQFCPAVVVSVTPETLGSDGVVCEYPPGKPGDTVVTLAALKAAVAACGASVGARGQDAAVTEFVKCGALVVRTMPNDESTKLRADYSGSNPTYMSSEAMVWAREVLAIDHVLVDLPSMDREDDQGKLLAHSAFWDCDPSAARDADAPLSHRTITELCFVPASLADGMYLLDLQVAPIKLDAAPSRPLLYPVVGRVGRGSQVQHMAEADRAAHPYAPTPLPGILCGTDGGFTADCVVRRLSQILDTVIASNDYDEEQKAGLLRLRADATSDGTAAIEPLAAGDEWAHHVWPYVGETWMRAPWWFVEHYFYRRMLDAARYWTTHIDPFQSQKDAALVAAEGVFGTLVVPLLGTTSLKRLLYRSLWGNRADLSLSCGKVEESHHRMPGTEAGDDDDGAEADARHILVDQAADVVARIRQAAETRGAGAKSASSAASGAGGAGADAAAGSSSCARIAIVLDNCGLEFVSDLAMVDALLKSGLAAHVELHCKVHPVFVSDVLIKDIDATLAWMAKQGAEAAGAVARLKAALADGRLQALDHPFWTSPDALWDLPSDLRKRFADCDIVLFKGDANYRRILGDRHFAFDTPFSYVTRHFPTSIATLRTCKAEVVLGLSPDIVEAVQAVDKDWLVTGKYGVIQYRR